MLASRKLAALLTAILTVAANRSGTIGAAAGSERQDDPRVTVLEATRMAKDTERTVRSRKSRMHALPTSSTRPA